MYPQSTRVISGLWRRRGRVIAQVVLVIISVGAAGGAALRLVERGGAQSLFGEHVQVNPASGPVGMAPFIELKGFERGRRVTVYLCSDPTGSVEDCVELVRGEAPGPLRSAAIPEAFPNAEEIVPAQYVLRAGPDGAGEYPVRGNFEVSLFEIGSKPRPRSFAGVVPQAIRVGEPKEIARSAACRPPLFLPDGRLAVGATVVDPTTGVTIQFDVPAAELAWSPVGDKLAILTPDRKEIRLAGPDGQEAVTAVREARGLLESLSWSPQGDHLAFIARSDPSTRGGPGPPAVKILNSVNAQITDAGPGTAVAWSSKPDLLAVERADGSIEASTPTGGRRRLLSIGHGASWSPDGSLIAFVAPVQGESSDDGWIARVDGSDASPVVGSNVCALSFSPSGESLAVVVDDDGKTSLVLRPIENQR
jgi:hypothetical protein